jgi:hypothetical protein
VPSLRIVHPMEDLEHRPHMRLGPGSGLLYIMFELNADGSECHEVHQ